MDNPDLPPLQEEPDGTPYRPSKQQWLVVGVIVAAGAGFVLYRYLKDHGLGQSAALYVGIPVVIAVVITLSAPPKTATGIAMKVTTLLLLLSVPILGEGACCVLLAAPIFYLVVYLVARAVDAARARKTGHPGPLAIVAPALLLLLALEGTIPVLTPPSGSTSTATRIIDLPASDIAGALALPLRFDMPRGGILAIGFPTPLHDSGGLDVGAVRRIEFDGAHHRNGPVAQHHWGTAASTLALRVTARAADSVTFTRLSDTTPIATWLRWDRIRVTWTPIDLRRTEIRWTVEYTRLLSPSWYFAPIERFVTWRAADYLIRAIDVVGASDHRHPARTV